MVAVAAAAEQDKPSHRSLNRNENRTIEKNRNFRRNFGRMRFSRSLTAVGHESQS